MILWIAWPASFTFFAGYPDSLLCALIVWSIYFARSQRWLPAGMLGFLAGLTKALGVLAALPLLWLAYKQRKLSGLAGALLCGAGAACFQAWLAMRHFPSAAAIYAEFWRTSTVAPWVTIFDVAKALARGGDLLLILNVAVLALAGYFAFCAERRIEYRIFATAAICMFLTKHTEPLLQSTTRYTLALFAAYPALASRVGGAFPFALMTFFAAMANLLFFRAFLDWGLVV
jgi:Gpi18-like mannosyltransferase